MLNLYDEKNPQTYEVDACGSKILIKVMTVSEKQNVLTAIAESGNWDDMMEKLAGLIVSIDGDEQVVGVLNRLVSVRDANSIIEAVGADMPDLTAKNSDSSLEPPTQAKAGNVAELAEQAKKTASDTEPALPLNDTAKP